MVVFWHWLPLSRAFAWCWFLFAIFLTMLSLGAIMLKESSARQALAGGDFKVVEGEVRNFHPMARKGDSDESFEVGGVAFHYADYRLSAGFNNTVMHGGPIRVGLPVRITYRDDLILRLEVRADHMAEVARRAESRSPDEKLLRRLADWLR